MIFKYYYHLHPLVESERGVVDQRVEKDTLEEKYVFLTSLCD
jgi:hypothetical protein